MKHDYSLKRLINHFLPNFPGQYQQNVKVMVLVGRFGILVCKVT